MIKDFTVWTAITSKCDYPEAKGERIAKVIARAGLCSRRDAERWIEAGRVKINDTVLTTPAVVVADGDRIEVDGKPLPEKQRQRLWRYHKPAGLVVSHRDEKGRQSVFDALSGELPRVVSVGRLDINTEGLLLLTNDGELARLLELPATGWVRRYRVRAYGSVAPQRLEPLQDGVEIEGIRYGPISAALDKIQGRNCWLTFALREGKNRAIIRVCEHLGLKVNRLIRTSFGPFQLGDLKSGATAEIAQQVLADQLGTGKGREPDKARKTSRAHRRRQA